MPLRKNGPEYSQLKDLVNKEPAGSDFLLRDLPLTMPLYPQMGRWLYSDMCQGEVNVKLLGKIDGVNWYEKT